MLARASMATVASGGRDVARATSRRAVVAPRGRRATPSPTSSASPRRPSRDAPSRTRSRRAARRLVRATPPSRSGVGDSVDVEVLDPSAERGSTRDDVVAGAESPTTAGALATGDDSDKRGPSPSSSAPTLAGVPVTPEIAAIVLVYFVQGILGLSRLAKDYFVKDELGLDPAQAIQCGGYRRTAHLAVLVNDDPVCAHATLACSKDRDSCTVAASPPAPTT